ncbi:MAG: hypothetical protein RLZZ450_594 [Pseudomonadota bacterium]|jgi:hypothetical protein
MTRLQRKIHRRTWLTMVVLVPLLCTWALKLRHSRTQTLAAPQSSRSSP